MPSTVAFPAITPNATELGIVTNSKMFVSPLSGYTQTASRKGSRWFMRMSFNNLTDANQRVLLAYLAFMEGQVNRIEVGDHGYEGARGALGTTVEIDGASQTGTTLDIRETSSGTSSIASFFRAGDLISFSNGTNKELKMVTSDASLVSGSATIAIMPEIHTSPSDGAAIETSSPVGTFMLASPALQWTNRPGYFADISVDLMEDIA